MSEFKNPFIEQLVEDVSIDLFKQQGYEYFTGENVNPGMDDSCLRTDYDIAYYAETLKQSLYKINPGLNSLVIEDAFNEIIRPKHSHLMQENKRVYELLTLGVKVPYKDTTLTVKVIDFENIENNSFIVSNQIKLKEHNKSRRPDVMVYVNGLPICMIEFKNPADENATLLSAFNQLETYKREFPQAFYFNQLNIISDGYHSRVGSLSAGFDRFTPWRAESEDTLKFEIEDIIKDLFKKEKLLHYIKNFITFIGSKGQDVKICAGYHQLRCVDSSLTAIKKAVTTDKRGGIVWHSTGSGKSFSMMFLAGMIEKDLELKNPTLLVITDRIALDSQLYKTFYNGRMTLASEPVSIEKSKELKEKLKGIQAGGIYFSTLQKFGIDKVGNNEIVHEVLSNRENIVIMVDEAHRSHNGIVDGSARYLRDAFPNATFIGFTGTPIDNGANDTRAIFGSDNDIYDMAQSVADGATVPIRYEARLAQVKLDDKKTDEINKLFDEVQEITDVTYSEKLKSKNARLEAVLGADSRLELIAKDITEHFRLRKEALPFSKAMIVCSTRGIAAKLYSKIIELKPNWHSEDMTKGKIKVVMSSDTANDSAEILAHRTSNQEKTIISQRIENEEDELELLIVCDMWLTGFDAPPINTMYFDKLIKEHNLIQAIARANRVYKEKPDGLIVDYIGLLGNLQKALSIYSPKDRDTVGKDITKDAVKVMLEKYSILKDIVFGFNYKEKLQQAYANNDGKTLLSMEIDLFNFIVNHKEEDQKDKFLKYTNDLQKSYALCATTEDAKGIRYDLVFFSAVKELILKHTNTKNERKLKLEDINTKIGQLVSESVESVKIIDLLELASMDKSQIDIFSPEFLEQVRLSNKKNTGLEILKKLLNDDIKKRESSNIIESRNFKDLLDKLIDKYHNGQIDSTQMLEKLIDLSKHIMSCDKTKKELGLSDEEIAFYTALADNESAKQALGDDKLKELTKALVSSCRKDVNFNFLERNDVRAKLRVKVKRLLKKYGYPPDMQALAIDNVVKQSMIIGENFSN